MLVSPPRPSEHNWQVIVSSACSAWALHMPRRPFDCLATAMSRVSLCIATTPRGVHTVREYGCFSRRRLSHIASRRSSSTSTSVCTQCTHACTHTYTCTYTSQINLNAYGYKPASFTRLVDGGALPAVKLDGEEELLIESSEILRRLDSRFPGQRMVPEEGSTAADQASELFHLHNELVRDWFSLVFYPVEGEKLASARGSLLDCVRRVDNALALSPNSPWFLGGEAPSIVDLQFIPSVERMLASTLYWKGLRLRGPDAVQSFPNLEAWLAAFEARPSYLATKADYYTHAMALPTQNGPGYLAPDASEIAACIEGLDGAWSLEQVDRCPELLVEPLAPQQITGGSVAARLEAAASLCANADAVVRFAARGASERGKPPFAGLADPNAEPNEAMIGSTDVSLRHVASALVDGAEDPAVLEAAQSDLYGRVDVSAPLVDGWEEYQVPNAE